MFSSLILHHLKTYLKIWFTLLLLICLNETSLAQTNVWISGKVNYEQKGTIAIYDNSFRNSSSIASTDINQSGNFHFKLNINKPQVIRLFNKSFYITPEDSVFVNVAGGSLFSPEKLKFKGRNATPYIYAMKYDSLKTLLQYKLFEYDFKNRLINYLDILNVHKNTCLNYLNDFSKSHTLSDNFKNYALSQIVYDYYVQLLFPFTSKKHPVELVPPAYSTIIDQINLTNDSLVDRMEYASTAIQLIEFKKTKYNGSKLQLINNNTTGLTKELLLTHYAFTLINSYESKDSVITRELIEKIDLEITNPEFRTYFNALKDKFNKHLTPFPKEVMLTALIDSVGHKLTFKDFLAEYKNKIIVLDFWASWCGPCKAYMPKINKIKKNFSNSDVEFVFMSLDEKNNDWRDHLKKTKIPGNHYWIVDNFKSALAKYLQIHAIPRYVIINRSGKIENIDTIIPESGENWFTAQINKLLSR